ncbi:acyl-CoA synthetase [Solirubrobacter ginsenosidimutans]|uniref:Acyl-CoA synthetase n=1 Tax=Solirubrobacter ginsenosidimutans TaxID=490573 RepID=A0A9X3S4N4_9ACTN|nr:acyl-CoA synthetase [Solirubrobacter ginsenosidimutans]MDA0166860.1 acyl-CoA synthetase [Solirubrobacter ginsenosidimutans]
MSVVTSSPEQLWPATRDLAEIERVPLERRGLPASSYHALLRAAELWPQRPALHCLPDAERWEQPVSLTFADLAADVQRAASVFAGVGIGRRDAVAIVSVNCREMITAMLAAEAVGVAAPINPALAGEHAAGLVRLSGAKVIVAAGPELDEGIWSLARRLAAETRATALLALRPTAPVGPPPQLEPLAGMTVAHLETLARDAPANTEPAQAPRAGDLASYLHTGGTTGAPKLAARTHGNEVANAWMIGTRLETEGAMFAALPLFHTNALIVTLLAPLLRGRPVVWAGPLGYRDPALFKVFWRIVERYRIAAMSAVPTVYATLATLPLDADISSLRMPIVGAAPLPRAVIDAFLDRTGIELCEGYGLTEGTCASACHIPGLARAGVGVRLPYQQVRAARMESERWHPLPNGEVGTLLIKGPNVFAGYLVATPEGPVVEPGENVRDGWLKTGDLGWVDGDGNVRLSGRAKDLIIRGGHNIDPAVIEDALLEHSEVTAAAAVGRPDAHAGEVPVAYVTLTAGASATETQLRAWATAHVPEPAAAPKRVEIIDAIPVTAVGKPFKPELRRRVAEDVAREALAGRASSVTARLGDGQAIVVSVRGVDDPALQAALGAFSFGWENAGPAD